MGTKIRKGGRVVYCATLETWFPFGKRGFESLSFRQQENPAFAGFSFFLRLLTEMKTGFVIEDFKKCVDIMEKLR